MNYTDRVELADTIFSHIDSGKSVFLIGESIYTTLFLSFLNLYAMQMIIANPAKYFIESYKYQSNYLEIKFKTALVLIGCLDPEYDLEQILLRLTKEDSCFFFLELEKDSLLRKYSLQLSNLDNKNLKIVSILVSGE